MGDFKKLDVWKAAHMLACSVYRNTGSFPETEAYGLSDEARKIQGRLARLAHVFETEDSQSSEPAAERYGLIANS